MRRADCLNHRHALARPVQIRGSPDAEHAGPDDQHVVRSRCVGAVFAPNSQ
ncbi:MAG: hypothetical protein ACE10K_15885 [Rhodothermales bacterium]